MASTYSTDLKLELMATGENAGTWGTKTNSNLNLLQQAIAGVQGIDVSAANVTLAMTNAQISDARNMVLVLNGSLTGNRQVLVPNGIEKFYIIHDQTVRNGYSLTIKTVSGTGYAIETTAGSSDMSACYSDGTDVYEISLNTLSGSIATAQIDNLAVTSAKLASFAVTSARVASYAITASRLATDAVTAIKITQSTITQSKLAANSVGPNQLQSTAVTPATYTAATITVDADGRITAASSGSAGAKGYVMNPILQSGSGTFTFTNATRIFAIMVGGGGSSGNHPSHGAPGGGQGAFAAFTATAPSAIGNLTSLPYSVGAGGGTTNLGNYAANAGGSQTPGVAGNLSPGSGEQMNGTYWYSNTKQSSSYSQNYLNYYGLGAGAGGPSNAPGEHGVRTGSPGMLLIYHNGD